MSTIHTSRGLRSWYSPDLHLFLENADLLPKRMFLELVGTPWVVYLCLPLALVGGLRCFALTALALCCFFLPMLLFTRVHIVHNYYQVSNGVFLVAAVALAVFSLTRTKLKVIVPIVLLVCITLNYLFFYDYFYKIFRDTATRADTREILTLASAVSDASDPNGVVFIFGRDWSAEIPYYSQRKAVMFPFWLPRQILKKALAAPNSLTGTAPLQAILFCPNTTGEHLDYNRLTDEFLRKEVASDEVIVVDGCTLYRHRVPSNADSR